mgnify:CR=1 FL=1
MKLKKSTIIGLCICSIFSLLIPGVIAANSEKMDSSTVASTNEYGTFKKFMPSILKEETLKVSTIPKGEAYVPKDTVINVELISAISSKTSHKGDIVPLKTSSNLVINDVVVIPAGTKVNGVITVVRKNGMFGRSGKLEFTINEVKTLNNVRVPLQYTGKKKARDDGGAVAVAAVVTVVGGLFMKGKNVDFPAGTQFEATVPSDTDLNVTLKDLKDSMDAAQPNSVIIKLK